MVIRNHHRRRVARTEPVAALLDGLAGPDDRLWPRERWPAMRLDRPLQVGARGGHGPIRYWVELYESGRRVRFRFERPAGFHGFHEFHLVAGGGGPAELVHTLEVATSWRAALVWWIGLGAMHDALIEDALDRAEQAGGAEMVEPASWSPRVRLLRAVLRSRRRPARPARVRP